MRVDKLLESFFSFLHHVVKHVDDVVVDPVFVLQDRVDGDLELLDVPDGLRDVLVDVMRVLDLLLLLEVDIPVCLSPVRPPCSSCRYTRLLSSVTSSPWRTL